MHMNDTFTTIDRQAWRKYLFYIDIVVWAIFAAAVAYVIGNIYLVGFYQGADQPSQHEANWWKALTGVTFMMGALSWVFFRFWKNGFLALRRPY
jgi:hypothetical protein